MFQAVLAFLDVPAEEWPGVPATPLLDVALSLLHEEDGGRGAALVAASRDPDGPGPSPAGLGSQLLLALFRAHPSLRPSILQALQAAILSHQARPAGYPSCVAPFLAGDRKCGSTSRHVRQPPDLHNHRGSQQGVPIHNARLQAPPTRPSHTLTPTQAGVARCHGLLCAPGAPGGPPSGRPYL